MTFRTVDDCQFYSSGEDKTPVYSLAHQTLNKTCHHYTDSLLLKAVTCIFLMEVYGFTTVYERNTAEYSGT